jgi:transcriptional regulator with XRE-family HTH domain
MPETGGAAAAVLAVPLTRKSYHGPQMTGAELRAHRKAAGLSQSELAKRAGVSRDAVGYWEAKEVVPTRYGAPNRFCEVLELRVFPRSNAHARGWGLTMPDPWQARLDAMTEAQMGRLRARNAARLAKRLVLCGAKTRKGTACRNMSEPGKRRCKYHGGKSTGPKTAEGRNRIAQAQRQRWAKWRAEQRD